MTDPMRLAVLRAAADHLHALIDALDLPEPDGDWRPEDPSPRMRRLMYALAVIEAERDLPAPAHDEALATGDNDHADGPDPCTEASNDDDLDAAGGLEPANDPPAETEPDHGTMLEPERKPAEEGDDVRNPILPGQSTSPPEPIRKRVTLPNGRAGAAYAASLDLEGLTDVVIDDADGCSLEFDADTLTFSGVPETAKDHEIRLSGLLDGQPARLIVSLWINADPRDLWKPRPSDPDEPHWKPDEAFAREDGDLSCVVASKRGRAHAQTGAIRDDDADLFIANAWHGVIVADGAGSARLSRHGSRIATRDVAALLPDLLATHVDPVLEIHLAAADTKALRDSLYQALGAAGLHAAKAIVHHATDAGDAPEDYLTTLLIVVARKVATGWFFAGFSIGDGGAAVFDLEGGALHPLADPDSGAFAGQTRFLLPAEFGDSAAVAARIHTAVLERFTAAVVMTDGISDPKFPSEAALGEIDAWKEFWERDLAGAVDFARDNPALEESLLSWLDFWSRGNHDDRTLGVLVP